MPFETFDTPRMKKYQGDPATEAQHILQQKKAAHDLTTKRQTNLRLGFADPGIYVKQFDKFLKSTPTVGKHFGQKAMLEQLPDILDRHLSMVAQQNGINI